MMLWTRMNSLWSLANSHGTSAMTLRTPAKALWTVAMLLRADAMARWARRELLSSDAIHLGSEEETACQVGS